FAETYLQGARWELREDTEARAAQLLPALMLGRVDGKSPVEYITEDADKERVRKVARILLTDRAERLDTVRDAWAAELQGMNDTRLPGVHGRRVSDSRGRPHN